MIMIGKEPDPMRDIRRVTLRTVKAKLGHDERRAKLRNQFFGRISLVSKPFAECSV
jgi:hypothetical protein